MHIFDYKETPKKLLTAEIVNLLTALHEFRGKQDIYIEEESDVLVGLLKIARIQSTKASNKIEGIYTSDYRLRALVMEKVEPRSRSEEEIAGYREVLSIIHESYEYIPIRPNNILQLHRDLYSYSSLEGGCFKNTDNLITESDDDGEQRVRFVPLPAFQTPEAMEDLCEAFNKAMEQREYDPLLLIPMFVLDFLSIHPFNDGNGRLSRLLTLLLLYRSGYKVGKYISMEMMIENSKKTYYEALQNSSIGWHENSNNYSSFVRYYLGVILKSYGELQERVGNLKHRNISKRERVRNVFENKTDVIKKSDIVELCPDISETTIERTLKDLLDEGFVKKVGKGRSIGYVKK